MWIEKYEFIAANFPDEVVNDLPEEINTGVYYGWAKVDNGPVHKMVMSIGWNPYFRNIKKSMVRVSHLFIEMLKCSHYSVVVYILLFCVFSQETHIINYFGTDFYGSQLRICITGYIRPEMDFRSLGKCEYERPFSH